jgi:hypothetical protein
MKNEIEKRPRMEKFGVVEERKASAKELKRTIHKMSKREGNQIDVQ